MSHGFVHLRPPTSNPESGETMTLTFSSITPNPVAWQAVVGNPPVACLVANIIQFAGRFQAIASPTGDAYRLGTIDDPAVRPVGRDCLVPLVCDAGLVMGTVQADGSIWITSQQMDVVSLEGLSLLKDKGISLIDNTVPAT